MIFYIRKANALFVKQTTSPETVSSVVCDEQAMRKSEKGCYKYPTNACRDHHLNSFFLPLFN